MSYPFEQSAPERNWTDDVAPGSEGGSDVKLTVFVK